MPDAGHPSPDANCGGYTKLSVIVPIFNERNTVVEIMRRMRAVELPIEREFVLVDDGSTDGTRQVLQQLGDSTARVVTHPRNQGKGAAIRSGLAHATGDLVLIQDADLEYDPEDWPKLLAPVFRGKATVVYGSRFTGERRNMLFLHWVGNRMLSLLTNVLYNTTLSDIDPRCGARRGSPWAELRRCRSAATGRRTRECCRAAAQRARVRVRRARDARALRSPRPPRASMPWAWQMLAWRW